MNTIDNDNALATLHPIVAAWFRQRFGQPTDAQAKAWPAIAGGEHSLLLAPTGSGKTLAAFLVAINRLMFESVTTGVTGVQILYLSPLKALGVDVEKNLQAPLADIAALAATEGVAHRVPSVALRTGDTSSRDRARMASRPPDILITTPESLFLMLTSKVRSILTSVDSVIVDEIHTMVATKRGAHLFVSLERLEALRRLERPRVAAAQRIGLSATQRPLDEVARLLGGSETRGRATELVPRPVHVIDAAMAKVFDISIEYPFVDAEAELADPDPSKTDDKKVATKSSWSSIHPRLVELIRAHRSTMIFVNSRRLAERLAGAINEVAEEEIAAAHHGSIARESRVIVEERLKSGELPAIVATSSLELGIDMGAVDLVIQIEPPPSIAAGVQRVGRGGHQVGAVSRGIIVPKHRGEILAAAAASTNIVAGHVESSRYPRNPLDVLAQQIVACVALDNIHVDAVFNTVRAAAPFATLTRAQFESVLDLLTGRYPADEFADLKPRIVWDRVSGELVARRGAQRVAIANAGTIPDRGLYGVFLADGDDGTSKRVGELDEEMVYETRVGEVFLLGASSWLVVDISHDRVLVVPAPGAPGRMPFWRGDGPGRPYEFGRDIGRLGRELQALAPSDARQRLNKEHGLDEEATEKLLDYLHEQRASGSDVPTDRRIVVERFVDEVGDYRIVVLSPFGARVHAPWAIAVSLVLRERTGVDVETVWTDDGIVLRMSETDEPATVDELIPDPDEIVDLVTRELGRTALFAATFRENAGRALLLPKRMPGRRTPLWLQRRRAADLLDVAARFDNFPIILETFREILGDVFDLDALRDILTQVKRRAIDVFQVECTRPSPFAASLLFGYVGNFIYDADAPLAERRAQALAFDFSQLQALLGEAELRKLLDPDVIHRTELELQRLEPSYHARDADELHDLLRTLGDLSLAELDARTNAIDGSSQVSHWLDALKNGRRVVEITLGGEQRLIASNDAIIYRDAFGCDLAKEPPPDAMLSDAPLARVVARYGATRGPFSAAQLAERYGLGQGVVTPVLKQLALDGRIIEGEFVPGGRGREWCDTRVLRTLKQRSLARVRSEIEPIAHRGFAAFLPLWHGLQNSRRGLDALLDVVQQLQGAAIPVSVLESDVLPARIEDYLPGDIDRLCAAGEVVWCGVDSLGANDGRIALYLSDEFPRLAPEYVMEYDAESLEARIVSVLAERGAVFFDDIVEITAAFPADVLKAVWNLVWNGVVGNDTLSPLRSLVRNDRRGRRERAHGRPRGFRSRRAPNRPGAEGRWSLLRGPSTPVISATERRVALTQSLLERHGVLTREAIAYDGIVGGFSALYPVLKQMEQSGRARRGYFVAKLGVTQFALPGADDRLRDTARENLGSSTKQGDRHEAIILSACDPANAYGAALPWPATLTGSARPTRSAGACVVLLHGHLLAYLGRARDSLLLFSNDDAPPDDWETALAAQLQQLAMRNNGLLLKRVNGMSWSTVADDSEVHARIETCVKALVSADFTHGSQGMHYRPRRTRAIDA